MQLTVMTPKPTPPNSPIAKAQHNDLKENDRYYPTNLILILVLTIELSKLVHEIYAYADEEFQRFFAMFSTFKS